MAEVQGQENRESDPTALAAETTATGGGKPRKPRATDGGPEILPDMERETKGHPLCFDVGMLMV